MNDRDKIEEAHGLWELAIVRLAAFVECGAAKEVIREAIKDERASFYKWSDASNRATGKP